jgi:hypothetical protein
MIRDVQQCYVMRTLPVFFAAWGGTGADEGLTTIDGDVEQKRQQMEAP